LVDDLAELLFTRKGYRVLKNGQHVLCSVTGARIVLAELKYWNVNRQEAYSSVEISLKRHQQDYD